MSSRSKIHYYVFLTTEACQRLSEDDVVGPSLREGKHFNCLSVEPNGYFVDLVLQHDRPLSPFEKQPRKFELSIPAHFVLYIISAHPDKTLGFEKAESVSGMKSDERSSS